MKEAERIAIEVFWRLHEGLTQQGPGSDDSTRRALALVPELPPSPRILDLGCGPGRQSLALARETGGDVIAVDTLPPFLAQVEERAQAAGLAAQIETLNASMSGLSYEDDRFDLLWSEGAIYNIGFGTGLREWRRLVRPGGSVAVTELSWLVDSPPEPIAAYWNTHYPGMNTREANEREVADAGYSLVASFVLPESDWWNDYFAPIDERASALRRERTDEAWVAALDAADLESSVVRDGLESFGYVFYVMQKPG